METDSAGSCACGCFGRLCGLQRLGHEKPEKKGWKSVNQEMKQLLENSNGPAGAKEETQAGTNSKAAAADGRDATGKQPPVQRARQPQTEQRAEAGYPQAGQGEDRQSASLEVIGDPVTAEGSANPQETELPQHSQKNVRNPPYLGDKQAYHP